VSEQLNKLTQIISRYSAVGNIASIWEIGSRDGSDAAKLAHAYTEAQIHSFEPNPDTFKFVDAVAQNSKNQIISHNFAISDKDGSEIFHKIDTERTITPWVDGNPGASSFFVASTKYQIEKYIQIPIKVQSRRADTLIEELGNSIPQLLWVDVQGSEKMVFEGFGRFLKEVKFIYVELSLIEIYQNAPLANEIVTFLKSDFYWTSNITKSQTQIDSLFIAKNIGGFRDFLKDLLLRISLKTDHKWGIRDIRSPTRVVLDFSMRKVNSIVKLIISRNNLTALTAFVFKLVIGVRSKGNPQPVKFRYRQILNVIPPYNPLKRNQNSTPEIELMIPVTQKDSDVLDLSVTGAVTHVQNHIKKISLVCPDSIVNELRTRYPDYDVVSENSLISPTLEKLVHDYFKPDRQGWIKQQFLKKLFVLRCSNPVLVLDADTIILKPKIWINSMGTQILGISDEYHSPYAEHFSNFSGLPNPPWSFVTHHQLMQPRIIREFLNENDESIERYIKSALRNEHSSISEYHSYGTWMFYKHADSIIYSKWTNQSVSKVEGLNLELSEIKEKFPRACSVSFHDYLKQ